MPKIFSDEEIELIRKNIKRIGREYFEIFGLKKTNIEEITKRAGIAKGSFYKFFKSKEELYFEVLSDEERIRDELIETFMNSEPTKNSWKLLLKNILAITETNKLFYNIYQNNEMEILMRKIPYEKLIESSERDAKSYMKLLEFLKKHGYKNLPTPEEMTGIFHSIFFIQFQKKEIGEDVYDGVAEFLIDSIAEKFMRMQEGGNDKNNQS